MSAEPAVDCPGSAVTGGTTRVYLARHGRTALNAEGRLRGLSDPPLDEVGVAESARLAEVLASKKPTGVSSSPVAAGGDHRAGDRLGGRCAGVDRYPAQRPRLRTRNR